MSAKIIRLKLSEKLWVNPTLHKPKKKRGLPCFLVLSRGDFWMIWRCHGIPCFHYCFLFRNKDKREQLHGNDSRRCYGNFLSRVPFRKYLITAMFKVLCQQLRGTLTTTFETQLIFEDFTDVDQHRCWSATRHLTYYCMLFFSQTSLVLKLDLALIE